MNARHVVKIDMADLRRAEPNAPAFALEQLASKGIYPDMVGFTYERDLPKMLEIFSVPIILDWNRLLPPATPAKCNWRTTDVPAAGSSVVKFTCTEHGGQTWRETKPDRDCHRRHLREDN